MPRPSLRLIVSGLFIVAAITLVSGPSRGQVRVLPGKEVPKGDEPKFTEAVTLPRNPESKRLIQAAQDYVKKQERRANGYQAVQRARHRFNPVTHQELQDITTIWVDAALNLTEKDLKVMDRLVRSQQKMFAQKMEQTQLFNAA